MKKHELIKQAYDNYPKGTVASWYNDGKDFHYTEFQSSGEFDFDDEGDIYINYPDDQTVEYVYCDGQWAKIVTGFVETKQNEICLFSNTNCPVTVNANYFDVRFKQSHTICGVRITKEEFKQISEAFDKLQS